MAIFVPRLTPPLTTDPNWKYWISPINHFTGLYALPNCTCYAYGRFAELLGGKPSSAFGWYNPPAWWTAKDGYERGTTPRLGAVAIYRQKARHDEGHAAVVEMILSDGSLVYSNSGFVSDRPEDKNKTYYGVKSPENERWFYTYGNYDSPYSFGHTKILAKDDFFYGNTANEFMGFIYNPNVPANAHLIINAGSTFAAEANKHIGDVKSWVFQQIGQVDAVAWNVLYVIAVASACGEVTQGVFPFRVNYSDLDHFMVQMQNTYGATFSEGPYFGKGIAPKVGDIICIRYNLNTKYTKNYLCSHIGIVTQVTNDNVKIAFGDVSGGKANVQQYSRTDQRISGILHPNWERNTKDTGAVHQSLYTSTNDITDATVRTVARITKDGVLSNENTGIWTGLLNYTGLASILWDIVDKSSNLYTNSDGYTIDYSNFDYNYRIVIEQLLDLNMPITSIIAIISAFDVVSGCQASYIDKDKKSYGLFGWKDDRFGKLQQRLGTNWNSNFSGQVDYFYSELQVDYPTLFATLSGTAQQSESDALTLANAIITQMYQIQSKTKSSKVGAVAVEIPMTAADLAKEQKQITDKLKSTVNRLWGLLVIVSNNTNSATYKYKSGNDIQLAKTIDIPSSIAQSGIVRDYTSYSFWLHHRKAPLDLGNGKIWTDGWAPGTRQRTLADLWEKQGKPSSRGIATLDGYYLVALTVGTYGYAGDIVKIFLNDGTYIMAIMADEKSTKNKNSSAWGHLYDNKMSIIEWEVVDPTGQDRRQFNVDTTVDLTGWAGKKVAKVENYGSWLTK